MLPARVAVAGEKFARPVHRIDGDHEIGRGGKPPCGGRFLGQHRHTWQKRRKSR